MGPNSRTDLYQTLDFWAEHLHPVCRPICLTRPPCVAADKNLSYWLFLVPSVQYAQSGPVSFFVLFHTESRPAIHGACVTDLQPLPMAVRLVPS